MTGWPWPLSAAQDFFEDLWDTVTSGFTDVLNSIAQWVWDAWQGIVQFIADRFAELFSWLTSVWQDWYAWIGPALQNILDAIGSIGSIAWEGLISIWQGLGEYFTAVFTDLYSKLGESFQWLASLLAKLGDDLMTAFDGMGQTFASALEGLIGLFKSIMDLVDIDALLSGVEDTVNALAPWHDRLYEVGSVKPPELVREQAEAFATYANTLYLILTGGLAVVEAASMGQLDIMISELIRAPRLEQYWRTAERIAETKDQATILTPLRHYWMALWTPEIPDARDLPEMWARGWIPIDTYTQNMAMHGLDPSWSQILARMAYTLPGLGDLYNMLWRELISPEQLASTLVEAGYRPEDIPRLIELSKRIPGPSDLIRFYVREAYLPEMQLELPPDFVSDMAKQGYDERWTRLFWGAHWVLVPLGQLYDMYHRDIIDDGILRKMLKFHDFTAEWRDRLIELSWDLPRLLDIRWGWEFGHLTDEDVSRLLRHRGQHPDNVPWILSSYKSQILRAETEALRREAIRDFQEGFIDEATLRANLDALGTQPEITELHVSRAKLRSDRDLKLDSKRLAIDRFRKGLISEEELRAELTRLGLRSDMVDLEVEQAKTRVHIPARRRRLTMAAILKAWRYLVFTDEEAVQRLIEAGLSPEDASIALATERARLEEQRARGIPTPRVLTSSALGRAYLADVITREEFRAKLVELGFSAEDVDLLLALWDDRKAEPSPETVEARELGAATIGRALREGLIDEAEAVDRWREMNFREQDVDLLVALYSPPTLKPPPPEEPRHLPMGTIGRAYQAKLIDRLRAREMWQEIGFREPELGILEQIYAPPELRPPIPEEPKKLTVSQIGRALRKDVISLEEAFTRILDLGYSVEDAAILISLYYVEES